jgi:hypothetical protein
MKLTTLIKPFRACNTRNTDRSVSCMRLRRACSTLFKRAVERMPVDQCQDFVRSQASLAAQTEQVSVQVRPSLAPCNRIRPSLLRQTAWLKRLVKAEQSDH